MNDDYEIVWSDDGSHKSKKKKEYKEISPDNTIFSIRLETKGRGGKAVTVIHDFHENPDFFKKVIKELKRLCGVGGTLKTDTLEIQGDQRDKVAKYFQDKGFKTKFTGG